VDEGGIVLAQVEGAGGFEHGGGVEGDFCLALLFFGLLLAFEGEAALFFGFSFAALGTLFAELGEAGGDSCEE
jgi:hypothetical protein